VNQKPNIWNTVLWL